MSEEKKLKENTEYEMIIKGTLKSKCITKFGITHYKYDDCEPDKLIKVNGYKVHKDCAEAFNEMKKASKKEGLKLNVVSGYRSSTYQKQVFKRNFNGKFPTEKQMKNRLKYSAPSGFSEHHTGLAIDINETEETFKNTQEYKWLMNNAAKFGFENSFPKNNAQGLGFEPWHCRYIGKNGKYKNIFAEARRNDPRYAAEFK